LNPPIPGDDVESVATICMHMIEIYFNKRMKILTELIWRGQQDGMTRYVTLTAPAFTYSSNRPEDYFNAILQFAHENDFLKLPSGNAEDGEYVKARLYLIIFNDNGGCTDAHKEKVYKAFDEESAYTYPSSNNNCLFACLVHSIDVQKNTKKLARDLRIFLGLKSGEPVHHSDLPKLCKLLHFQVSFIIIILIYFDLYLNGHESYELKFLFAGNCVGW